MHDRSYNESLCHRFISSPSREILGKLGLFCAGELIERGDHNARAIESAAQGGEKYMSSKEMHRHLDHIQELVPRFVRYRPTIVFCTYA